MDIITISLVDLISFVDCSLLSSMFTLLFISLTSSFHS